jgi:hypothetical protein
VAIPPSPSSSSSSSSSSAHSSTQSRPLKIPWGPPAEPDLFSLTEVKRDNIVEAWGADCKRHSNSDNQTNCKKNLKLGIGPDQLTADVAQKLLKLWLIRGGSQTITVHAQLHIFHI